jgi:hypothetical protein
MTTLCTQNPLLSNEGVIPWKSIAIIYPHIFSRGGLAVRIRIVLLAYCHTPRNLV